MVGEGVLHEALKNPNISEIVIVNRKPLGIIHSRVKEILLPNFFDIGNKLNEVKTFDACLFCLGVSSVGMKKDLYEQLTYDLTLGFAKALINNNQIGRAHV